MKNIIIKLSIMALFQTNMASAMDFNESVSNFRDTQNSIVCLDAQIDRLEMSKELISLKSNGMYALCDARPEEICMELRSDENVLKSKLQEAIKKEEQLCK